MPSISLRGVTAEYQLLSVVDYNLKHRVVQVLRRRRVAPESITALYDVDLTLHQGTRLGLVGENGAGKSTLLAVMAGILPPSRGVVRTEGKVLALLGGAGAGFKQEATGVDNVVGIGVQLGEAPSSMRRRMDDIVEFSGLQRRIHHPVHTYSSGMQARLRFSILTSLRPDVLLLDEGLATADAAFARQASARLTQFVEQAGVVVVATHSADLLRQQVDQGLLLSRGRIVASGALNGVLEAYDRDVASRG